jgi:hypothetical protein
MGQWTIFNYFLARRSHRSFRFDTEIPTKLRVILLHRSRNEKIISHFIVYQQYLKEIRIELSNSLVMLANGHMLTSASQADVQRLQNFPLDVSAKIC